MERGRRSLREGGPPKRSQLPLAGQPCDVLSLPVEVSLSLNTTIYGSTCDLRQRLKEHNEGRSPHTAKFRPWTLVAYVAFCRRKDRGRIRKIP